MKEQEPEEQQQEESYYVCLGCGKTDIPKESSVNPFDDVVETISFCGALDDCAEGSPEFEACFKRIPRNIANEIQRLLDSVYDGCQCPACEEKWETQQPKSYEEISPALEVLKAKATAAGFLTDQQSVGKVR